MRVLVTGGNGYVGRTLTKLLLPHHDVCVIDSLRYGRMRLEQSDLSKVAWHQTDIRNRDHVKSIIEDFQPDAIIHLAAIHFIPECEADPELAISTNVLGTANLASCCPTNCRFVFASTGAVYQPEPQPHHESNSTLGPADVYGWTKLQGEQYVRYFAQARKFSACVIRLFNVIGPGETNPHVLPEIVAQLKAGRTKLKLGNLDAKRDYVHVSDVARGFACVATANNIENSEVATVNLGTQQSYSVSQLLEHLTEISSIDIQVESDPSRMRPSDRPFLAADINRIQQRFQWQPAFAIREALADLWQAPDLPEEWIEGYR